MMLNYLINLDVVSINLFMYFPEIGVGGTGELSPELYKRGLVYVESREGAKKEAPYVVEIQGELGELALGKIPPPPANKIRIFCSLGEKKKYNTVRARRIIAS